MDPLRSPEELALILAIVNFPVATGKVKLLLPPLQLTTTLCSVYLSGSAWPGASSQLLINLGGAGCIPGHLTTSSSGGNLGTRRPGAFSYIKRLTTSQPGLVATAARKDVENQS